MFELNKTQWEKIEKWIATHKDVYCGAVGARYTYQFTPSTIGMFISMKDQITGEELDLTEMDDF